MTYKNGSTLRLSVEIIGTDAVGWPVNTMLTLLPYRVMAILFINCNAYELLWEAETTFDCCQQQEIGDNLCFRKSLLVINYCILYRNYRYIQCLLPNLFTYIELAIFSQKELYFSLNIFRIIFHSGIFSEFRSRCRQIGKFNLHVKW